MIGILRTAPRSLLVLFIALSATSVVADSKTLDTTITYLGRKETPIVRLSLLDLPIKDNGRPGALLGLGDNQTTGSFLGQIYNMDEQLLGADEDLTTRLRAIAGNGRKLFIADLEEEDLLLAADLVEDGLFFNVRASDDTLRNEKCRANIFHITPSRSMYADALVQYLSWKRWRKVVLVTGRHDDDRLYANAVERAANRFKLKIVQKKNWTSIPGARRTDSGHHSLQQEVPSFTRFKGHDIVIVADETDEFGEYLSYRMASPRPVAGTQGLMPTSWHRTQEQWGATQVQRRFEKIAGRTMSERDYASWAAMRTIGEAITITGTQDVATIREYLLSSKFKLAGFKGVPLTFRDWNGQLRQPVLIVGPRMLVSVSPQKGFLHERSHLDTLGFDRRESACTVF